MNDVCSWSTNHCFGAFDVQDAPSGVVGLSFDDGPAPASLILYKSVYCNYSMSWH
jgi:hypothetical protein